MNKSCKISDTDGLETASRLLKANPALKIIILTGYDLSVYRHEAKRIGICGFLNKNISPDDLLASLIRVFHGSTCFPPESNELFIEDLTSMEMQHIFEKLGVS